MDDMQKNYTKIMNYTLLLLLASQSCPTLCVPMDCSTAGFPVPVTISWSLLKLMSIELLMPSNHLILCRPLHLLLLMFLRISTCFQCSVCNILLIKHKYYMDTWYSTRSTTWQVKKIRIQIVIAAYFYCILGQVECFPYLLFPHCYCRTYTVVRIK